jgi:cytochrome c oxidase subunit III
MPTKARPRTRVQRTSSAPPEAPLAITRTPRIQVVAEAPRTPLVPSGVMGMLIFVFTELMLFAGFMSAFTIIKGGSVVWPPPGQPRLPFAETAFNTVLLLLSGVMLVVTRRVFLRDRAKAQVPMLAALVLAASFVVLQGREWVALLAQGLTLTSSALGSFFFLVIGLHAIHVVIAIGLLARTYRRLRRGWLASSQLATAEVFWYFVVGVWPVIYLRMYP